MKREGALIRDDGLLNLRWKPLFRSSRIRLSVGAAKGRRLGFGLIKNHPFVDGNKRSAHAMPVFWN
ncbi:MAG: Fic family protein [Oscillospiraceae bacterium]